MDKTKLVSEINWSQDRETILSQMVNVCNEIFQNTDFKPERNSTLGEKDVDVFFRGDPSRICHIWPKMRDRLFDVWLRPDFYSKVVSKLSQLGIQLGTNKTDWASGRVSLEETIDILMALAGKEFIVDDINTPIPPDRLEKTDNGMNVWCPKCKNIFSLSERCPECGQLIKYVG